STTPVLIDFWAPWCGPCRMVAPSVEEMATQYAGKLKVGKLNVDDHPSVAQSYGITGIPALLFFEGGQVVDTVVGAVPESNLQRHVAEVLSNAYQRARQGTRVQYDQPASVRVYRRRSWRRSSREPCQTSISVA